MKWARKRVYNDYMHTLSAVLFIVETKKNLLKNNNAAATATATADDDDNNKAPRSRK